MPAFSVMDEIRRVSMRQYRFYTNNSLTYAANIAIELHEFMSSDWYMYQLFLLDEQLVSEELLFICHGKANHRTRSDKSSVQKSCPSHLRNWMSPIRTISVEKTLSFLSIQENYDSNYDL